MPFLNGGKGKLIPGRGSANPLTSLLNNFPGGDEVVFNSLAYGGTGQYYFLHQDIGNRLYWRILLDVGNNSVGQAWMQLKSSTICEYYRGYQFADLAKTVWSSEGTNSAFPSGKYIITNSFLGAYLEMTTHANCTTAGALMVNGVAPYGAMCLVTIDGDNTLADLLPTAQDLVTGGTLPAAALVANGGTLNPTDRIMDSYNLPSNFIGPGAASTVFFSKSLAAGVHVVRITVTAYTNVAALPGYYFLTVMMFSGGPNAAGATGSTTYPVFILKQNTNTVMAPGTPEISWNSKPTGATGYEWVGHTGSLVIKTVPSVTVNGAAITPADYTGYAGTSLAVITQNNVRHSETGTNNLGILDLTYALNASAGLTITHSLAWAVSGVAQGYPCMFTVDRAVFDRYNGVGSGVIGTDLADNDDAVNFNSTLGAAYCWDYNGYQAAVMYIPDLAATVESWLKTTTEQLWWADISANAGTWKKLYATRFKNDEAYTNATVWASEANYRVGWFTVGADSIFGALT
jgi:hypothetical protein